MWLLLVPLLLAAVGGVVSKPTAGSATRKGEELEWPLLNASLPSAADRSTNGVLANHASHIALVLASAALRALASAPAVPSDAWRGEVVDVAAGLLEEEGRLAALLGEPAAARAVSRPCARAGGSMQRRHPHCSLC